MREKREWVEPDVRAKKNANSRTAELKDRAVIRLLRIMRSGDKADVLASRMFPIENGAERDSLEFQAKLAALPKLVQFAYHKGRYDDLRKELKELGDGPNRRKFELMKPTIERQIAEVEDEMYGLYDEIKAERAEEAAEKKARGMPGWLPRKLSVRLE